MIWNNVSIIYIIMSFVIALSALSTNMIKKRKSIRDWIVYKLFISRWVFIVILIAPICIRFMIMEILMCADNIKLIKTTVVWYDHGKVVVRIMDMSEEDRVNMMKITDKEVVARAVVSQDKTMIISSPKAILDPNLKVKIQLEEFQKRLWDYTINKEKKIELIVEIVELCKYIGIAILIIIGILLAVKKRNRV